MNQGVRDKWCFCSHTYTQRCFTSLHKSPNSIQHPSILSNLYSVCACLYNCGRVTELIAPSGIWTKVKGRNNGKSTAEFIGTL